VFIVQTKLCREGSKIEGKKKPPCGG